MTAAEGLQLPPGGTQLREAAEKVAEVFGCSVEEEARVLSLGISARVAEQAEQRAQEDDQT